MTSYDKLLEAFGGAGSAIREGAAAGRDRRVVRELAEQVREAVRNSRAVTRAELEEDVYAALRRLEDR